MILHRQESILLALAAAFILAAFAALAVAPAAWLARWSAAAFTTGYAFSLIAWFAAAAVGHLAIARRLPHHDPLLFPITLLLAGWGLTLIWRLAPAFGIRQTVWLLVGVAGMSAMVYAPGDLRWLRRYRYLWLALALGLTALTLIAGVNPSGGGPTLWLGCCGLYFQPSEALKLLFVVFSAAYLAEKIPGPRKEPSGAGAEAVNVPLLAPVILAWAFSLLLLVSQRDLGTGSLIFAIFIILLYLATGRRRFLALGGVLLVIGGALTYLLFDVVRIRVEAWINPFIDPSGRSFQIVQSLIALARGGLFGKGPGIGAPTVIPVVHSDFVFAAIVEEWGLIGGAAALALLAVLVLRGFRAAALARGAFRRLLAGGLAALVGLQSILIIGGVIKVLPLTGVTLPFLSYGGSSLLIQFIIIGLLLKLSDDAQSD
jgi:cell division protein FtsW (lipid II flippase)